MMSKTIQVGDVVLDLAQGRAMHVLERYDGDAAEWSDENDYDLTGNYGNSRLGATESDAVFECVYCNSLKSEPSKTYAFPESRLARVETEAADDGRPVADRILVNLLDELFQVAMKLDDGGSAPDPAEYEAALRRLVLNEPLIGPDMFNEVTELAEAARLKPPEATDE